MYKYANALKFDNDFQAFNENRNSQRKSWIENQKYFLDFLIENKISKLYAYGFIITCYIKFFDLEFKF